MNVNQKIVKPCPYDRTNFISKILFIWILPLFQKGIQQNLEFEDLYQQPQEDDAKKLVINLQNEWDKELLKKKPSFAKTLINTFKWEWLKIFWMPFIVECVFAIAQPLFLGVVIKYFIDAESVGVLWGWLSAAGVCACQIGIVVSDSRSVVIQLRTGMRVRIACVGLMYRKFLKLTQKSFNKTTVGQIINLMSNDVQRFDRVTNLSYYLFIAPIQTIIILGILWYYLGSSCIAGVVALLIFVSFQGIMGKFFSNIRRKTAKLTDDRINLMSEIIYGMRVIKMYSWEKMFIDLVSKVRKLEISSIRRACFLNVLNLSMYFASSKMVLFVCFTIYVYSGGHLTADKLFVTMALFNTLRTIATYVFPKSIALLAESYVTCQRIQTFLMLAEKLDIEKQNEKSQDSDITNEDCKSININDLTANWDNETETVTLSNITASVKQGELLAVVGSVGSGKSSLFQAILGELPSTFGKVVINGNLAYTSQEPWLFNASIRDNIIFDLEFDEEKYHHVVEVCALERDFRNFPQKDKTLVGENGVKLSGGQKARINLARALYKNADIYLLDDPLSAVDSNVAKHLFNRCIIGYLKSKATILVTHQIQFLKKATRILVLRNGKSLAYGTYDELINSGLDFIATLEKNMNENLKRSQSHKRQTASRQSSTHSDEFNDLPESDACIVNTVETIVNKIVNKDDPQIEEETKLTGSLKGRIYWNYIQSGAGPITMIIVVASLFVSQGLFHASDIWLSKWTNQESERQVVNPVNNLNISKNDFSTTVKSFELNSTVATERNTLTNEVTVNEFVTIYSSLIAAMFLFTLIRASSFFMACMRSSIELHNSMFAKVIRAPIVLFEKVPLGRILNRFTKDMGTIDDELPATAFDINLNLSSAIGAVIVVSIVNAYLIIPAIIMMVIAVQVRKIYIRTARDIKRLEAISRSHIYSHVATSYYGLTTLRAFNCQSMFISQFNRYQDDHSGTWFLFINTSRALSACLEWVCVAFILCVVVVLMVLHKTIRSGDAGLALSSALTLVDIFQWGIRQSTDLESQMTSVERVIEYTNISSEAALESPHGRKPPSDWPWNGQIIFSNVNLFYESSIKPTLVHLNCVINGGEKVGIVGRTGAGKSSLLAILFRMFEPEGQITIDGIDTKSIGLHDLRKAISIIPQDPIIFNESVRSNLDPFNEHSDDELWNALEEVQLKDVVLDMDGHLSAKLIEGGSNISAGQRQLICLARALLRNNKILVLDEATANVDHKTDTMIQNTIRRKFSNCTVLTIAHRLITIIDSDRVMVLDAGRIVQFDHPYLLLKNPESLFSNLVAQTGNNMAQKLLTNAKIAYNNREQNKHTINQLT